MLKYLWSEEKNKLLKQIRGIGFQQVVEALVHNRIIANIPNPNQVRYPKQKIYIVIINNYTYAIPYIKNNNEIFLKTIYPSHKYQKQYNKKEQYEK